MSVRQQVSGSKQIADAIGDINKVMKEMSESAQQGKETAQQLSTTADELKGVIETFHMSTNGDEIPGPSAGEHRDRYESERPVRVVVQNQGEEQEKKNRRNE